MHGCDFCHFRTIERKTALQFGRSTWMQFKFSDIVCTIPGNIGRMRCDSDVTGWLMKGDRIFGRIFAKKSM